MFEQMIAAIQEETLRRLFLVRVQRKTPRQVKRERVAKVTGESGASDGTVKKQPVKKVSQDRPQRPLPLRQRPEVEEVHLQGVSQRAAVRTHTKAVDPACSEQGGIGAQLMPPCCVPAFDDQEEKESTDGTDTI